MEFREDLGQRLVGYVYDGVPRADPVVEVQTRHGPDLNVQVGIEPSGGGNHVGGQVDTDDVHPDVRQNARRCTRAAADVGNDRIGAGQSGEAGQHRAIQRLVVQVVVKPFGVFGCGEVVAL